MARANNNGWDFVKEGGIYQYKEEGCVAMVKIIKDTSDAECYKFEIEVLASDGGILAGEEFSVSHSKNPGGYWNEMTQFYSTAVYVPLPLGKPWSVALPGHEHEGLKALRGGEEENGNTRT